MNKNPNKNPLDYDLSSFQKLSPQREISVGLLLVLLLFAGFLFGLLWSRTSFTLRSRAFVQQPIPTAFQMNNVNVVTSSPTETVSFSVKPGQSIDDLIIPLAQKDKVPQLKTALADALAIYRENTRLVNTLDIKLEPHDVGTVTTFIRLPDATFSPNGASTKGNPALGFMEMQIKYTLRDDGSIVNKKIIGTTFSHARELGSNLNDRRSDDHVLYAALSKFVDEGFSQFTLEGRQSTAENLNPQDYQDIGLVEGQANNFYIPAQEGFNPTPYADFTLNVTSPQGAVKQSVIPLYAAIHSLNSYTGDRILGRLLVTQP